MASLGLYTYVLPMAHARGLGGWGFAMVWAWGIGGVLGSGLIGRPLDAWGPRRLLPLALAFLLTPFLVVRLARIREAGASLAADAVPERTTVVDVGCGTGSYLTGLLDQLPAARGLRLDTSVRALEQVNYCVTLTGPDVVPACSSPRAPRSL